MKPVAKCSKRQGIESSGGDRIPHPHSSRANLALPFLSSQSQGRWLDGSLIVWMIRRCQDGEERLSREDAAVGHAEQEATGLG